MQFNNMAAGTYTVQAINTTGQLTLQKNISLVNSVYELKGIERTPLMASGIYTSVG